MIEVNRLTKRYGDTTAVHDLSFTVRPGHVTGFLGPNGAGKTTTLRMLLGLIEPTSGTATVSGHSFRRQVTGGWIVFGAWALVAAVVAVVAVDRRDV
jgi:ABC-2 type transport system ATP-binding protein